MEGIMSVSVPLLFYYWNWNTGETVLRGKRKKKGKGRRMLNCEFLVSCVRAKRLSSARKASVRLSNRIDRYLIGQVSTDRFDRFTPRCRYRGSARGGGRRRRRKGEGGVVYRRAAFHALMHEDGVSTHPVL